MSINLIPILAQLETPTFVSMDVADWWINKAATWGLSFVFLCCVLCILLYIAVSVVGLAKQWIPKWFESSIESHERVAKAVDTLVETLDCIHEKTHSVHRGVRSAVKGVSTLIRKNKTKFNIGSDVMVYLDSAEEALESGIAPVHKMQRKGEDEGNDGNSSSEPSPTFSP